MNEYTPDRWQVIKLESEHDSHYRVFATWSGGYLHGQSWKMNSGIESVELIEDYYCFTGSSGSVYSCHKNNYGSFGYGASVLSQMMENSKDEVKVTILPEDTNWLEMDWK